MRRLAASAGRLLGDRQTRRIRGAAIGAGGAGLMLAWKAALLAVSPSGFVLANVLFAAAVLLVKVLAVRALRRPAQTQEPVYRRMGAILLAGAVGYVLCCLPAALGLERLERTDQAVAIVLAAVTFGELVLAVRGAATARREGHLVMEAYRMSGLATASILLAFTQTALVSAAGGDMDGVRHSGVLFGAVAVGIGVAMLLRGGRPARICGSPPSPAGCC